MILIKIIGITLILPALALVVWVVSSIQMKAWITTLEQHFQRKYKDYEQTKNKK